MTNFRTIKEPPKFTLTKFEAARRQLNTAINLWFMEEDPVSIHALAYASHEIIHKLYRKQGLADLMYDSTIIKDEHRSEFAKMVKEDANFIKHANKADESETIEFKPLANELFILMSVIGLSRMGHTLNDHETGFMFWMNIHNPHWWQESEIGRNLIPDDARRELAAIGQDIGRGEFFKLYLQLKQQGVL